MDEADEAKQATPQDIAEHKRKCWNSHCKRTAWFEDWCGYHHCLYHAYHRIRYNGGSAWFEIKELKLRWPF